MPVSKLQKKQFPKSDLLQITKRENSKTATNNENKQRIFSVDIFRLLGAFSVILLHIPYAKSLNTLPLYFHLGARWAVPFFFLISGYFFQNNYKLNGDQAFIISLRKLLIIALFSNLIYIPLMIRWQGWESTVSIHIITRGASLHLWFIHALIISSLFLWLVISSNLENKLLYFAFITLLFAFCLGTYSFIFDRITDIELSMYVVAISLLMFGYKLHIIDTLTRRVSIMLAIILIATGFLIQFIEAIAFEKYNNINPHIQSFTIGTLIYSLGMFIMALKLPINRNIKLAQYGKRYSLAIYLFHPLIVLFLTFQIFPHFSFTKSTLFQWISPLFFIFMSYIFIMTFEKLFPKVINFLNGNY